MHRSSSTAAMHGSKRSRTRHMSYDFTTNTENNGSSNSEIMELFRELYLHRRDMFKKMFPKLHDEFDAISEQIEAALSKKLRAERDGAFGIDRRKSLQRSSSVGSPRITSRGVGGEEAVNLERFKVRTVEIDGTPPSGGGKGGGAAGGGGGQTTTGPKPSGGTK